MRRRTGAKIRIDPLTTTAGLLFGVFLYVILRKYIDGTLPEPFDTFVATLMR